MKIKYPRTYHVEWSPGVTSDDKIQHDLSNFFNKEIIITEKYDGENTTLMNDCYYARSLDSNNHPSRNYVKRIWGNIKHDIPLNFRICGENLYAKHSIQYHDLDDYFLVFSIWENDICLSWNETVDYCNLLNLKTVKVLYDGIFDINKIKSININTNIQEGFVIRLKQSFNYSDFSKFVVKWVRDKHIQTDKHWSKNEIIVNNLKN